MKAFLDDNFLLETKAAERLYHEYAADMPIFDYHCHLPVAEIAGNKNFENLTAIWLHGDHYKWRAMRANGVDEHYITGPATDQDKFRAWAATVPKTLRNPAVPLDPSGTEKSLRHQGHPAVAGHRRCHL